MSGGSSQGLFTTSGRRKPGIAIVGAGSIVTAAHLPAYSKAGFPVLGIYDIDSLRAANVAAEFRVARVYGHLEELLADRAVEVVDIAVPPAAQPAIVQQVLEHKKHLLCQKPLALSSAEAERLVAGARQAGVKLAVNVNMRWDPAIREAARLIGAGRLGELQSAAFHIRYHEDWSFWPWLVNSPRLLILVETIHLVDAARYLFGEPQSCSASCGRQAGQELPGETWVKLQLRYAGGFAIAIDEDSSVPASETTAQFFFQGTKGLLTGRLGIYYDYPVGRPDALSFCEGGDRNAETIEFAERWIPDAFSGTMGELLSAIQEDREPSNSGHDHLATLRLIESVYSACGVAQ